MMPSATQTHPTGEVTDIMRALEADVVDAVWAATEPLLPAPPEHPLGCHRHGCRIGCVCGRY